MQNEDRILELLVEALQRIDKHSELFDESMKRFDEFTAEMKAMNQRIDEQGRRTDEHLIILQHQMAVMQQIQDELRTHSRALERDDGQIEELAQRTEQMHQASLEQQQYIRDMLNLVMGHHKVLLDKGLIG